MLTHFLPLLINSKDSMNPTIKLSSNYFLYSESPILILFILLNEGKINIVTFIIIMLSKSFANIALIDYHGKF